MSRYVVMARKPPVAYWDQSMPPLAHPMVYQADPAPTGLLNADGAPIYKLPDPIGFLPDHHGDNPCDDDGCP